MTPKPLFVVRRWSFAAVAFICCLLGHGQDQNAVDSVVRNMVDSSFTVREQQGPQEAYWVLDTMLPAQEARYFDDAALEALRGDPRYQYEREVSEAPNAWDRFWDRLGDWIKAVLERMEKATGLKLVSWFWDYIWFVVFAVALIIILIFLRKRMFSQVFAKSVANVGTVRTLEEDITADDLPEQLAHAEQRSEWRRALRLQYLLVLRHLVDEGRINWKPEHTDRDYQDQLKDTAERAFFGRLSFIFKWVWYGEAELDRAQYERLSAGFIDFRRKRAA